MKNCAFQFATDHRTVAVDTGLITREEADELWEQYLPEFIAAIEASNNPEMALWIDMADGDNYHKAEKHYQSEDFLVLNDRLYKIVV